MVDLSKVTFIYLSKIYELDVNTDDSFVYLRYLVYRDGENFGWVIFYYDLLMAESKRVYKDYEKAKISAKKATHYRIKTQKRWREIFPYIYKDIKGR